jgi:hypothetical protein
MNTIASERFQFEHFLILNKFDIPTLLGISDFQI